MNKLLMSIIAALALSQSAVAGMGQTTKITLESVAVLGDQLGARTEIKVKNGFTLPSDVFCDTSYISTKNTADPNGAMLSSLRDAIIAKHRVRLWITDEQADIAVTGRCSLLSVEVF